MLVKPRMSLNSTVSSRFSPPSRSVPSCPSTSSTTEGARNRPKVSRARRFSRSSWTKRQVVATPNMPSIWATGSPSATSTWCRRPSAASAVQPAMPRASAPTDACEDPRAKARASPKARARSRSSSAASTTEVRWSGRPSSTFSTKVAWVMTPGAVSSKGVTRWSQVPTAVAPTTAIRPRIRSGGMRPCSTSVADQVGKSRTGPA